MHERFMTLRLTNCHTQIVIDLPILSKYVNLKLFFTSNLQIGSLDDLI